ncbi:MAG TPA: hypothetical protein VHN36_19915 [Ilumatobacteraceae bacterium]|nr:hypothetical protein [Ilumatobacteraceae bacterium]
MTVPVGVVVDFAGSSFEAVLQQPLLAASPHTRVAVAIPAWFTMADRHQLLTHLDPDGVRTVGLVSSSLAVAFSRYAGRSRRSRSPVLILDVRVGWSAGLIHFTADGPTEVAAWGVAPHDVAGRFDDDAVCAWFVDHLFSAASAVPGTRSIRTVLVIDDVGERTDLVRHAVRRCAHPLAQSSVNSAKVKEVFSGGSKLFARPDGMPHSVGALANALTVRADGDPERLAMCVVAAEHAQFPSTTRQLFELGPDDGAPLHFDIYEQHRHAPDQDTVDHRLVVRAHLVRERGYDQNMMVTFELGSNGVLSVGPANAWNLDWQPGSLDLESRR